MASIIYFVMPSHVSHLSHSLADRGIRSRISSFSINTNIVIFHLISKLITYSQGTITNTKDLQVKHSSHYFVQAVNLRGRFLY